MKKDTGTYFSIHPKKIHEVMTQKRRNYLVNSGTLNQGVVPGRRGYKTSQVVIQRNPCRQVRIGRWNVRTMLRKEKIVNIKQEMERYKLKHTWFDGNKMERSWRF